MRVALAILLIVHGIAHGVGFAVPWHLVSSASGRATIAIGTRYLGESGARALGLAWLALAVAFVTLGALLLARQWHPRGALVLVVCSLVMCALSLPDTRIGLCLNLGLVLLLLGGKWTGSGTFVP